MTAELRQLITDTQIALKTEPESARARFESNSSLHEGLLSRVNLRQHSLTVDEPEALGGTDAGPNPVELVLAALGTCQEITYKAYATALGIPIESVSVSLTGDLDLRGFFAVDDQVRAGYQSIQGTVRLVSDASAEDLAKLRQVVNAHCPVLDIVSNPVPVELGFEVAPSESVAAE